jgi:hypothetical protein
MVAVRGEGLVHSISGSMWKIGWTLRCSPAGGTHPKSKRRAARSMIS